jgi:hypothetical protein
MGSMSPRSENLVTDDLSQKIAGARTDVHATAGSHDDPRELGSLSLVCVHEVRAGLPCGVGQEITLLEDNAAKQHRRADAYAP